MGADHGAECRLQQLVHGVNIVAERRLGRGVRVWTRVVALRRGGGGTARRRRLLRSPSAM